MTVEQQKWIRSELGPRIDALEMALNGLNPAQPETSANVRKLLQMLQSSSREAGLLEIAGAAGLAGGAHDAELKNRVAGLIQMLREQGRRTQSSVTTILLVGSEQLAMQELEARLKPQGRDFVRVAGAKEAEAILRTKEVVFIVTDLFLPDQDVRQFVSGLRCRPLTASVPVIVITSKVAAEEANLSELLPDVDGFFGKPLDMDQIQSAIEQRLRRAHERIRAAHRDPLTGLLNRAAFGEYFERAMTHHRESKEPIAIAVMKLDRYQQVCDQHGVQTGERMLRHFGNVLSRYFRATDVVARWGGCEFMALFPGEDNHGASRAMERIREALAREPFAYPDGTSEAIKIYAGVSVLPDQESSMAGAIDQADKFMYQAKAEGGDKTVSALSQPAKRKERVVLVTSSDTTSKVLNHLLIKEGYELLTFPNIDEAVASSLQASKCHLVIVDDIGQSAADLTSLRRIRTLPRQSRTPIILLTSSETSAAKALEYGANDYAMKPLDLMAFMKTVRRMLTRGLGDTSGEGQESLLIVSNDLHTLIILGTALQKQSGFIVLLARGGTDGVNQLGKRRPAAVLIDLPPRGPDWQPLIGALGVVRPAPVVMLAMDEAEVVLARKIKVPVIKSVFTKPLQPLNISRQVQENCGIIPAGAAGRRETADILKEEIERVMRMPAAAPAAT